MLKSAAGLLALPIAAVTSAQDSPDGYSLEAPAYYFNEAMSRCQIDTACLKLELSKADRELNEVYRARFSYLPKSKYAGLRDAERAWIASRDKDCSWLSSSRDRFFYMCMLESTINRKYRLLRNIGD